MSNEEEPLSLPERPGEAKARSLLKIGACTSAAGIALAVTGDNDVSRWLTVLGFGLLVWGLHRFGRLGVDASGPPHTTR
jgi:hypothetical protein